MISGLLHWVMKRSWETGVEATSIFNKLACWRKVQVGPEKVGYSKIFSLTLSCLTCWGCLRLIRRLAWVVAGTLRAYTQGTRTGCQGDFLTIIIMSQVTNYMVFLPTHQHHAIIKIKPIIWDHSLYWQFCSTGHQNRHALTETAWAFNLLLYDNDST